MNPSLFGSIARVWPRTGSERQLPRRSFWPPQYSKSGHACSPCCEKEMLFPSAPTLNGFREARRLWAALAFRAVGFVLLRSSRDQRELDSSCLKSRRVRQSRHSYAGIPALHNALRRPPELRRVVVVEVVRAVLRGMEAVEGNAPSPAVAPCIVPFRRITSTPIPGFARI